MSVPFNQYKSPVRGKNQEEDTAMNDISHSGSMSATRGSGTVDPPMEGTGSPAKSSDADKMVDFENEDFMVPSLFSHELSEESLQDDDHLFVLWANLKIPQPENPGRAADAMFDCLVDFIEAAGEEDKKFIVFPYNLSNYKAVSDLLAGVVDLDSQLEEIDEWLSYFPQAKPRSKGSNVYTAIYTKTRYSTKYFVW